LFRPVVNDGLLACNEHGNNLEGHGGQLRQEDEEGALGRRQLDPLGEHAAAERAATHGHDAEQCWVGLGNSCYKKPTENLIYAIYIKSK